MATLPFDATSFWKDFAIRGTELADLVLSGAVGDAYQLITQMMDTFRCPYVCELTCDDDKAILVFTPESDPKLAREIDQFVKLAPDLADWTFYSRRQRKPVHDALVILQEVYGLDARDASFEIAKVAGKFNIVMYTKAASELTPQQARGFIDMFLEHALGEDSAMKLTGKKDVRSTATMGTIPPEELVARIVGR